MIVERACAYVPDVPVGVSKSNAHFSVKVPKGALTKGQVPEEPTRVEKVPNEEPTRVVKVPMVASDLVRLLFKLACLKL